MIKCSTPNCDFIAIKFHYYDSPILPKISAQCKKCNIRRKNNSIGVTLHEISEDQFMLYDVIEEFKVISWINIVSWNNIDNLVVGSGGGSGSSGSSNLVVGSGGGGGSSNTGTEVCYGNGNAGTGVCYDDVNPIIRIIKL